MLKNKYALNKIHQVLEKEVTNTIAMLMLLYHCANKKEKYLRKKDTLALSSLVGAGKSKVKVIKKGSTELQLKQ